MAGDTAGGDLRGWLTSPAYMKPAFALYLLGISSSLKSPVLLLRQTLEISPGSC